MAKGIFTVNFTEEEILAIQSKAKEQFMAGEKIMQWTDSGVNVQKGEPMRPADVLDECRYALQKLNPEVYGRRRMFATSRTGWNFQH